MALPEGPETIQDVVHMAHRRLKTSSVMELARQAQSAGFSMTHSTLSKIKMGKWTPNRIPQRGTIEALAWLAGIAPEAVLEVLHLQADDGLEPYVESLPTDVDLLDSEERAFLHALTNHFLRRHRAERANNATQSLDTGESYIDPEDVPPFPPNPPLKHPGESEEQA